MNIFLTISIHCNSVFFSFQQITIGVKKKLIVKPIMSIQEFSVLMESVVAQSTMLVEVRKMLKLCFAFFHYSLLQII